MAKCFNQSGVTMDWQPIETAPKDGTQILAYAEGSRGLNYFSVAEWATAKDYAPRSVADWFWAYAIRPTHWMPLPAPPSERRQNV